MRHSVVTFGIILLFLTGYHIFGFSGEKSTLLNENDSETNEILKNAVFTDLNGLEFNLQKFEGKTVLIDIWETWCVPCIQSMPTLQQLINDYPDDFVVLAVSPGFMDSEEQVRDFIASNDYDFEFVFGEDLARDLQVQSIPYKVYVNPEGNYVKSVFGSHGAEADYENTKKVIESFL